MRTAPRSAVISACRSIIRLAVSSSIMLQYGQSCSAASQALMAGPLSGPFSSLLLQRQIGLAEFDPRRGMVGRFFLRPRPFVDARALQTVGRLGRAQQMVDAEARVALPAAGGIV